jgi:hypothetical protein
MQTTLTAVGETYIGGNLQGRRILDPCMRTLGLSGQCPRVFAKMCLFERNREQKSCRMLFLLRMAMKAPGCAVTYL